MIIIKKYGIIYIIRNIINNKVYIGQTIYNFNSRYKNNIEKYTCSKHLKSSIQKYGIENFEVYEEFDIAYSKEELDKLEDMYIKIYSSNNPNFGYNSKFGGSHGKHNDETKIKCGVKNIGKNPWNKGLPKELNPITGLKRSDKTKDKLRKQKIGSLNPMYGKKPINVNKVICITTEEIFNSVKEAGEYYNIKSYYHIGSCCTGKRNSCGKLEDGTSLKWMYYNEYLKTIKSA